MTRGGQSEEIEALGAEGYWGPPAMIGESGIEELDGKSPSADKR